MTDALNEVLAKLKRVRQGSWGMDRALPSPRRPKPIAFPDR